jgi:RNA polymerase sigma-70 factor, ECF subfamily
MEATYCRCSNGGITIINDDELVLATLNGDVQAFSLLVEKYSNALCSVAYGVMGDFHLAQDIVQESFIKAYYKLNTLKDTEKIGSWLYAITYRQSVDWKRKLQKERHALERRDFLNHPVSFEELVDKREIQTEVWDALGKLDELNRIIITLFHMSGFSMESIGKFLNMSISAVESRHRRARKRLKQDLMDGFFDGLRSQYSNQTVITKVTTSLIKQAGQFYIPVSDKKRSSEWFVEQFGLSADPNGHLTLPSGQTLYLLQFKHPDPAFSTDTSIPVLSFDVDNINEVYIKLKKDGISVDERIEDIMGEHFFFYDLDNNRFGIYQSQSF